MLTLVQAPCLRGLNSTQKHLLWQRRFTRAITDVGEIHDRCARAILNSLTCDCISHLILQIRAMPQSVYDASEVVEMPKNLRTTTVSPPGSPESTISTSSAVSVDAVVVPPDIRERHCGGKPFEACRVNSGRDTIDKAVSVCIGANVVKVDGVSGGSNGD